MAASLSPVVVASSFVCFPPPPPQAGLAPKDFHATLGFGSGGDVHDAPKGCSSLVRPSPEAATAALRYYAAGEARTAAAAGGRTGALKGGYKRLPHHPAAHLGRFELDAAVSAATAALQWLGASPPSSSSSSSFSGGGGGESAGGAGDVASAAASAEASEAASTAAVEAGTGAAGVAAMRKCRAAALLALGDPRAALADTAAALADADADRAGSGSDSGAPAVCGGGGSGGRGGSGGGGGDPGLLLLHARALVGLARRDEAAAAARAGLTICTPGGRGDHANFLNDGGGGGGGVGAGVDSKSLIAAFKDLLRAEEERGNDVDDDAADDDDDDYDDDDDDDGGGRSGGSDGTSDDGGSGGRRGSGRPAQPLAPSFPPGSAPAGSAPAGSGPGTAIEHVFLDLDGVVADFEGAVCGDGGGGGGGGVWVSLQTCAWWRAVVEQACTVRGVSPCSAAPNKTTSDKCRAIIPLLEHWIALSSAPSPPPPPPPPPPFHLACAVLHPDVTVALRRRCLTGPRADGARRERPARAGHVGHDPPLSLARGILRVPALGAVRGRAPVARTPSLGR